MSTESVSALAAAPLTQIYKNPFDGVMEVALPRVGVILSLLVASFVFL
jgi:hypothetical protein